MTSMSALIAERDLMRWAIAGMERGLKQREWPRRVTPSRARYASQDERSARQADGARRATQVRETRRTHCKSRRHRWVEENIFQRDGKHLCALCQLDRIQRERIKVAS